MKYMQKVISCYSPTVTRNKFFSYFVGIPDMQGQELAEIKEVLENSIDHFSQVYSNNDEANMYRETVCWRDPSKASNNPDLYYFAQKGKNDCYIQSAIFFAARKTLLAEKMSSLAGACTEKEIFKLTHALLKAVQYSEPQAADKCYSEWLIYCQNNTDIISEHGGDPASFLYCLCSAIGVESLVGGFKVTYPDPDTKGRKEASSSLANLLSRTEVSIKKSIEGWVAEGIHERIAEDHVTNVSKDECRSVVRVEKDSNQKKISIVFENIDEVQYEHNKNLDRPMFLKMIDPQTEELINHEVQIDVMVLRDSFGTPDEGHYSNVYRTKNNTWLLVDGKYMTEMNFEHLVNKYLKHKMPTLISVNSVE